MTNKQDNMNIVFSINKSYITLSVNNNSDYIFPLNFNELLLLEDKMKNILLKLSRTQPPSNECLDYWSHYYDSTLMNNYLNLFRDSNNAKELDKIAHIDALCLILALDSSTSNEKFIKDGWEHGFNFPSQLSSVGKSSELRLILEDGSEIDGYYSSVCGYSSSSSFYTEHLINSKDVKYWRYKDVDSKGC